MNHPLQQPIGLGTAIKNAIHVATAPLPPRLKRRIRECPSCKRRAEMLNTRMPNVNPLAKPASGTES